MQSIFKRYNAIAFFTSSIWMSYLIFSCNQAQSSKSVLDPGNDPNFSIQANTDDFLKRCDRKVVVFDIPIYAVPQVESRKLLHAANILAQYLDNDEDGQVDNPKVLSAMQERGAFMVMWKKESDLNRIRIPTKRVGQDLGNDETHPAFVANGLKGPFDASLEEVWHIITHAGYAHAYPTIFGEYPGTQLSDAMDKARGGQFKKVPKSYPVEAWYTYDDKTCDYACMVTEYFYWAMTTLHGAQANRAPEIQHEWRPNTSSLLKEMDPAVYELLSDPQYQLPTQLPDGTYRQ